MNWFVVDRLKRLVQPGGQLMSQVLKTMNYVLQLNACLDWRGCLKSKGVGVEAGVCGP